MSERKKHERREALVGWLEDIRKELADKEKELRRVAEEVNELEAKAEKLMGLLSTLSEKTEEERFEDIVLTGLGNESISDGVYAILTAYGRGLPVKTIIQLLVKGGKELNAAKPYNMVFTILSRDRRFKKVAPGTFGLKERDAGEKIMFGKLLED